MQGDNKGVSGGLTLAQIAEQDAAREAFHARQKSRHEKHRAVKGKTWGYVTPKSTKGQS